MKDRLFLLLPNFAEGGHGPLFCGECAVVEGMLSYYPQLRQELDVTYVKFQRPRPEIVKELGPDNQSSPVLILGDPKAAVPPSVTVKTYQEKKFINNEFEICHYLAAKHHVGDVHHPLVRKAV